MRDRLLLIEVADTSLAYDRGTKLPLYARARIPEVWIVYLEHGRVEVYRQPTDTGYQDVAIVGRGSMLTVSAFPDLTVLVDDILP